MKCLNKLEVIYTNTMLFFNKVHTLEGGGDDNITPVELVTGTFKESEIGTARPGIDTCTFCSPPRFAVRLCSPATLRPVKYEIKLQKSKFYI